jgi:hypothetical protein
MIYFLISDAQNRKVGKSNNLKFGSNKTKGLKQDSQNQIRPEGGDKIGNKKNLVFLIGPSITVVNCLWQ